MINENSLRYPDDEISLKQRINALNNKWQNFLIENSIDNISSLYVSDGFYPYYTHQKKRILFIGREALGIAGCDYIKIIFESIKSKEIGGISLNRYKFHALMLYIAYGLQYGFPNYRDIPYATEIGNDFATQYGVSYAFMNLSKFSNESGKWQSNEKLMDMFLKISSMSNENLFAKEIEILNPDLIISMNLKDKHKYLGTLKSPVFYGNNQQVCAQKLVTDYGEYDFLDCYHFSAPRKKWEIDYYLPIIEAAKIILQIS